MPFLHKRTGKENPVHTASISNRTALIIRHRIPCMEINYNIDTGEHSIIYTDPMSPDKQQLFLNKAIAWAKHNIKK